MGTPFMEAVARLLADRNIATVRFEFAYMAARRQGGSRKPPPKAERLMDEYRAAVAGLPKGAPLLIGGKSMGGRVASLVADELHAQGRIAGLVCLGYPFHPPKKPDQLRTAHLVGLRCPTLIVQGDRDPFGSAQRSRRPCAIRRRSAFTGPATATTIWALAAIPASPAKATWRPRPTPIAAFAASLAG